MVQAVTIKPLLASVGEKPSWLAATFAHINLTTTATLTQRDALALGHPLIPENSLLRLSHALFELMQSTSRQLRLRMMRTQTLLADAHGPLIRGLGLFILALLNIDTA